MGDTARASATVDIATLCVRANPQFNLLPLSVLSPQQRQAYRDIVRDPNSCAILQPRTDSLYNMKAIPSGVAELWSCLQSPQASPQWAKARLGHKWAEVITRLIWDGILETETSQGFVPGARAYELLWAGAEPAPPARGHLAQLSLQALKYAQALPILDASTLSARLYFFNRMPVSPYWKRRFPNSAVLSDHLGAGRDGFLLPDTKRRWVPVPLPPSADGWFMWSANPHSQSHRSVYKLYVSPGGEDDFAVLQDALTLAISLRCSAFKVGNDIYGLLRPDKLVLYFDRFEDLEHAAHRYQLALGQTRTHGVPFTAELCGDGLLSWGKDPPIDEQTRKDGAESWRVWVTNRLAVALISAKAAGLTKVEPWQFALARLHLEGVDTQTWALRETPWLQEECAPNAHH